MNGWLFQIGHEGISALVEGPSGKNLKELKIDNCVNVTEATLRKIVECCPDMEILIFYNCDRSISKYWPICNCKCLKLHVLGEMMFTPQENQLKNLKQLSWTINWYVSYFRFDKNYHKRITKYLFLSLHLGTIIYIS